MNSVGVDGPRHFHVIVHDENAPRVSNEERELEPYFDESDEIDMLVAELNHVRPGSKRRARDLQVRATVRARRIGQDVEQRAHHFDLSLRTQRLHSEGSDRNEEDHGCR